MNWRRLSSHARIANNSPRHSAHHSTSGNERWMETNFSTGSTEKGQLLGHGEQGDTLATLGLQGLGELHALASA